jgi:reactive intermediate/imine deaminase
MERKLISSGSKFEQEVGYSRAVVVGSMIFVAGCTGFDYATNEISDKIEEQVEQTFKNIESALEKAGATLQDVVRATYLFKNNDEFEQCWPIFQRYFGEIRPALTVYEVKFPNPNVKIEIEVTAVKTV